jgi:hypothetical protein
LDPPTRDRRATARPHSGIGSSSEAINSKQVRNFHSTAYCPSIILWTWAFAIAPTADCIPIQIWQLTCPFIDAKRDYGLQGEKQMLRTLPESEAVCGSHVGRRLVGSWTLDLKPSVERNVVRTGSGAESLELSPIDPAGRQMLILVCTLLS